MSSLHVPAGETTRTQLSPVRLGLLVAAWYAGTTYLPRLTGTCFDGLCEGAGEMVASFAWALVFLCVPIALEMALRRVGPVAALRRVGLTRADGRGVGLAALYLLPLLAFHPMYGWMSGTWPALRPGWGWDVTRAFVTNGLVEEAMMRGFVFRHLRERRTFWSAAGLTTLYFVGYHFPLIATQGPMVGVVAVIVAVPVGLFTALLYERGHGSLWGPVLMHAVNNALAFVFVYPDAMHATASAAYLMLGILVASSLVAWAYRSERGRRGAVAVAP